MVQIQAGNRATTGAVLRHLDLFSGIGGFALAAKWVGWETVGFCEIDPYCQKVLRKHWPDVSIYEDVRELKGEQVGPVDIISGGFPCTDISVAGKQAGIEGEQSGLWSELARIIGEVRPTYAVLENVSALLSGDSGRWFQRVLGDLAEIGYDCEWHCIPASAIGAPHRRDRVWIVAYPESQRCRETRTDSERSKKWASSGGNILADTAGSTERGLSKRTQQEHAGAYERSENVAYPPGIGQSRQGEHIKRGSQATEGKGQTNILESISLSNQWATEPNVGRVANGIPRRVDRLRGLGNAIVPQVAEIIFRAINDRS